MVREGLPVSLEAWGDEGDVGCEGCVELGEEVDSLLENCGTLEDENQRLRDEVDSLRKLASEALENLDALDDYTLEPREPREGSGLWHRQEARRALRKALK
jgi:hypothetical protein